MIDLKSILCSSTCFHFQVVEEVRRSLNQQEGENAESFVEKCLNNLKVKLDSLIYYGISKHAIKPPSNPSEGKCYSLHFKLSSFSSKGKEVFESDNSLNHLPLWYLILSSYCVYKSSRGLKIFQVHYVIVAHSQILLSRIKDVSGLFTSIISL